MLTTTFDRLMITCYGHCRDLQSGKKKCGGVNKLFLAVEEEASQSEQIGYSR